jgi:hypothetical protein
MVRPDEKRTPAAVTGDYCRDAALMNVKTRYTMTAIREAKAMHTNGLSLRIISTTSKTKINITPRTRRQISEGLI